MIMKSLVLSFLSSFQIIAVVRCELDLVWAPSTSIGEELVWDPEPQPGYFVIGQYVTRYAEANYENPIVTDPDGRIPVARTTEGSDELIVPDEIQPKIDYNPEISFWGMVCPENYVALSGIATMKRPNGTARKPDKMRYRCVHKRITQRVEILFSFHGNGKYGLWAMPVVGNSVGSFYVIAKPTGDRSSTTGYQLLEAPRNYTEPVLETETLPFTKPTTTQRTTKPEATTTTRKTENQLTLHQTNTVHIIIGVVLGTTIAISIFVIWLIIFKKINCWWSRNSKSATLGSFRYPSNADIPEFVYQETTTSSCESATGNTSPQGKTREMKFNVLYEQVTPDDLRRSALRKSALSQSNDSQLNVQAPFEYAQENR